MLIIQQSQNWLKYFWKQIFYSVFSAKQTSKSKNSSKNYKFKSQKCWNSFMLILLVLTHFLLSVTNIFLSLLMTIVITFESDFSKSKTKRQSSKLYTNTKILLKINSTSRLNEHIQTTELTNLSMTNEKQLLKMLIYNMNLFLHIIRIRMMLQNKKYKQLRKWQSAC